ncbi:MAG TPA: hypothetical protein VIT38_11955 [Allosphingosinicella sp.]
MLNPDEIKVKAIQFDILHPNVERDYVFGWLLKSIYENDYLRARLIFKGATAFGKRSTPTRSFRQTWISRLATPSTPDAWLHAAGKEQLH